MKCPKCGAENSETAKICSLCLAKLTEDYASRCPAKELIAKRGTKIENFLYGLLGLAAVTTLFVLGFIILAVTGISDFISGIINLAENPFGLIFLLFLTFMITGILAFIKYLNSK